MGSSPIAGTTFRKIYKGYNRTHYQGVIMSNQTEMLIQAVIGVMPCVLYPIILAVRKLTK